MRARRPPPAAGTASRAAARNGARGSRRRRRPAPRRLQPARSTVQRIGRRTHLRPGRRRPVAERQEPDLLHLRVLSLDPEIHRHAAASLRTIRASVMAQNKTIPTAASPSAFIDHVADEQRRKDCKALVALMREATGHPPKMWGASIVGFDRYPTRLRERTRRRHHGDRFCRGSGSWCSISARRSTRLRSWRSSKHTTGQGRRTQTARRRRSDSAEDADRGVRRRHPSAAQRS